MINDIAIDLKLSWKFWKHVEYKEKKYNLIVDLSKFISNKINIEWCNIILRSYIKCRVIYIYIHTHTHTHIDTHTLLTSPSTLHMDASNAKMSINQSSINGVIIQHFGTAVTWWYILSSHEL